MTATLLDIIKNKYPLEKLEVGEFANLKVSGMKFTLSAYKAKGLGHVSVMSAKGFFGLMKMDTVIIVPQEKDLPLFSYDQIVAAKNGKLYVELYDTVAGAFNASILDQVKEQFVAIPDFDPGKHWYDNIKLSQSVFKTSKDLDAQDKLAGAYLNAFLEAPVDTTADVAKKKEKTAFYVHGLLTNGGPSTDVFLKKFGVQKTTELFEKVLFGTEV